ncbi:Cyp6a9 [Trypoxylus dichotomus]
MSPPSILNYIILLALALSLLILYLKRLLSYWKRKGVPYLQPTIPFGNIGNPIKKSFLGFLFKDFYDQFKRMGKPFGGIYSYVRPVFIPIEPDIIKTILVQDFSSFQDRGFYYNEKDQPTSASIFTVDGGRWWNLRTKLTSIFTSVKIQSMFKLMLDCGDNLEQHVKQLVETGKPMKVSDCVRRLTTDIIGSCAFGIDCNSFEDTTFFNVLEKMYSDGTSFFMQTFCHALPDIARFLKIPLTPHKETNFIINSINEVLKFRAEKKFARKDFLQMLLEMVNKGDLDVVSLHGQCIIFFMAGHDTSASTLTFSVFELARHQDIQEKLRKEITDVIAKYEGAITYEGVQEMKYLEMVVSETLRLYPPAQVLKRKCASDFRLPNSNTIIEKGTLIFVPILGLHLDPDYFPDPFQFVPERFSKENIRNIEPYSYLPFGEGPRNCIGKLANYITNSKFIADD